jgi:hypothetical protein
MSKIFELFGYRLDDNSTEAQDARKNAFCPFMQKDCDGGGNRYSSNVTIKNNAALETIFPNREIVPAGVCSLQLTEGGNPWIVCPRRLLALNRTQENAYQNNAERKILDVLGYQKSVVLGVWSEVKLKYEEKKKGIAKRFDYTFDYVLMPLRSVSQTEAEKLTGKRWQQIKPMLEAAGYSLAMRGDEFYVEDFPSGAPSIIEIMTSSTSGGNKSKRTTIPMAFEDALTKGEHKAPGVNYRQVWARMVSQLIVKSEVGLNWGGKTLWLVQDVLVAYICASTALDIRKFLTEKSSQVNMLSLSYNRAYEVSANGVIELDVEGLFAGPISSSKESWRTKPSFQDMIRAPMLPDLSKLTRLLIQRSPSNRIIV